MLYFYFNRLIIMYTISFFISVSKMKTTLVSINQLSPNKLNTNASLPQMSFIKWYFVIGL